MMKQSLFTPYQAGILALEHRIVLAPMTRIRADEDSLAPNALMAEYYAQRASKGGLLITEAVHISPEATPIWTIYQRVREIGGQVSGIWTEQQMLAWQEVTKAVHAKGGKIACQLLHAGRVAQKEIGEHPLVKGSDFPLPPISSSSVPIAAQNEQGNQYNWDQPSSVPRALERLEMKRLIGDYQKAAQNALQAGFDSIELHAAHGYLIEQFLADGVNQREDIYGGSVENRCRLLFEIVEALIEIVGAGRLGVRLSPIMLDETSGKQNQTYFGVTHSNPEETYFHAINGLNKFPLAYLLLTEPRAGTLAEDPEKNQAYRMKLRNAKFRAIYHGTLMAAGGFTPQNAAQAVADGLYDLIAFGRWFISNPDLPARIKEGTALNIYDRDKFYGKGIEGYTDYPDRHHLADSQYRLMEQSHISTSLRQSLGHGKK